MKTTIQCALKRKDKLNELLYINLIFFYEICIFEQKQWETFYFKYIMRNYTINITENV